MLGEHTKVCLVLGEKFWLHSLLKIPRFLSLLIRKRSHCFPSCEAITSFSPMATLLYRLGDFHIHFLELWLFFCVRARNLKKLCVCVTAAKKILPNAINSGLGIVEICPDFPFCGRRETSICSIFASNVCFRYTNLELRELLSHFKIFKQKRCAVLFKV